MTFVAAVLLAASVVDAQPMLARTGDCGWVHGRYDVTNGSRINRIWVIGSDHLLSLDVPDEGRGSVALPLKHLYDTGRFTPFAGKAIFGDFYVCARERRIRGHMQPVHLKLTRNLHIVSY